MLFVFWVTALLLGLGAFVVTSPSTDNRELLIVGSMIFAIGLSLFVFFVGIALDAIALHVAPAEEREEEQEKPKDSESSSTARQ